jgi:hypothetical protein
VTQFIKAHLRNLQKSKNGELLIEKSGKWKFKFETLSSSLEVDFDHVWVTLDKKRPQPGLTEF